MNDKERLILTSIIGAQLGPLLDKLAVPAPDQAAVVAWFVAGIPVVYHLIVTYGPRVMARWFPAPEPAGCPAGTVPAHLPPAAGAAPGVFSSPQE